MISRVVVKGDEPASVLWCLLDVLYITLVREEVQVFHQQGSYRAPARLV